MTEEEAVAYARQKHIESGRIFNSRAWREQIRRWMRGGGDVAARIDNATPRPATYGSFIKPTTAGAYRVPRIGEHGRRRSQTLSPRFASN